MSRRGGLRLGRRARPAPERPLDRMVTEFVALSADPTPAGPTSPDPAPAAVEPAAEPTTEPAAEPTTEPAAEPTTEPAIDPTTEPAAEPITEPATDRAAEDFVSVDLYAPEEPIALRGTRVASEPARLAAQADLPALDIQEPTAIVAGENLHKQYGSGPAAVHALNGVSIDLLPGSFTAIMGPSGSGKSTLMHLLAGLDTPTSGEVWIGPTRLGELGEADRTRMRRSRVGFVFQSFNLLPMLTVEQNICLPQRIAGQRVDNAWLEWLLNAIGLPDRRRARPAELSGGEQQRVSLARALLGKPTVVFADEPTGNLDSRSSEVILTMLRRAVADLGQTIVIVTHDGQAAARADRIVYLEDGRIVRET